MRFHSSSPKLLLSLLALCTASAQQHPASDTWKQFTVQYGSTKLSKFNYVLDLGILGTSETKGTAQTIAPDLMRCSSGTRKSLPENYGFPSLVFHLEITYHGAKPVTLNIIAHGSRVAGLFDGPPRGESVTLEPGQSTKAQLFFTQAQADPTLQDLNMVIFVDQSFTPIFSITFDYVLLPGMVIQDLTSPALVSGAGNAWSATLSKDHRGYELQTGPAPYGYTPVQFCYALIGDRECGRWSHCDPFQTDKDNVGISFQLQGDGRVMQGTAWLRVAYGIDQTNWRPVLK